MPVGRTNESRAPLASSVLARRVKEVRGRRSQEWLAQTVTALGHPMHQTAIAKIEAGDRKVTVDEMLLLAVALEIPPSLLLLPVESDDDMAVTPTMNVYPWRVWEWLLGEQPLPGRDTPTWYDRAKPVHLYADVREAQKSAEKARLDVKAAEFERDRPAIREARRRYVRSLSALQDALMEMEQVGYPTARLIGAFRDDLVRLGIRQEEEQ